jgi:hypothetical protein
LRGFDASGEDQNREAENDGAMAQRPSDEKMEHD